MGERICRKLGFSDLQLFLNMDKETGDIEFCEDNVRLFLSNPTNWVFACIEDDKIIGYAYGYELNRLNNDGNMLYIHAVTVHEHYRGQGVGKQMMKELKQLCKLSGLYRFYLYAHKTNTAACDLYNSAGGIAHRDDNVSYFFDVRRD